METLRPALVVRMAGEIDIGDVTFAGSVLTNLLNRLREALPIHPGRSGSDPGAWP